MGKDYSSDSYKKSYNNEYSKVYSTLDQKKKRAELLDSYNTISKKLNDTPYSRSEKNTFEGLAPTIDTKVDAAGPRRREKGKIMRSDVLVSSTPQPQVQASANSSQYKDSPKQVIPLPGSSKPNKINSESGKSNEVPPPYVPPKEVAKSFTSGDYSYINSDSFEAPILPLTGGKYRNIYTEEIVDEIEARNLLRRAGYEPKDSISMGWIIFICIVPLFAFKFVGPIILIAFGIWNRRKNKTVFKKVKAGVNLNFPMPAIEEELNKYQTRASVYILVGVLVAIYQVYILIV
ncbi:MAG: hypothetical protein QM660_02350 [Dysgonomonas sp.]